MDKRWILIIIIFIMAVCCGYFVVTSSDTVGNALVDVNKSTVTVPPGFAIGSSSSQSTEIVKREQPNKILIKDFGKQNTAINEYKKKLNSFSKNEDIEILNNTSETTDNYELYTIYYQSYSEKSLLNQSISYVYACDHTFFIKESGFSDMDEMSDTLSFMANTLKPDYKKSQE